jgi:hypothetical protein
LIYRIATQPIPQEMQPFKVKLANLEILFDWFTCVAQKLASALSTLHSSSHDSHPRQATEAQRTTAPQCDTFKYRRPETRLCGLITTCEHGWQCAINLGKLTARQPLLTSHSYPAPAVPQTSQGTLPAKEYLNPRPLQLAEGEDGVTQVHAFAATAATLASTNAS